jgi:glycine amidinotransferase
MSKIVSSWNEWAPLERVIVGRPEGTNVPAPEPIWNYHQPPKYPLPNAGPFPEEMIEAANDQMANFIDILENEGVTVDRIEVQDFMHDRDSVSTPDWTQENSYGVNNVRDVTLVHGNYIVEGASGRRSRYWEFLNLRPTFEEYFEEDDEMVHIAAPKPRLTEESYVDNYDYKFNNVYSEEEKRERHFEGKYAMTEKEPLWDAADAMRFGKDIFHQISALTNWSGFDWLERMFDSLGIRYHPVQFGAPDDPEIDTWHGWRSWHIDCNIVPLKEGLAMYNPDEPPVTDEFWDLFEKNDWDLIPAARPTHVYDHDYYLSGPDGGHGKSWISMNTFSIDPETVVVEAHETAYINQLRDLGFDVIPVPYEKVVPLGGALHCTTLDVKRQGGLEDYFPNQVDGY